MPSFPSAVISSHPCISLWLIEICLVNLIVSYIFLFRLFHILFNLHFVKSTSLSSQFYATTFKYFGRGFMYISFFVPNKFFDSTDLFISFHNSRNLVISILYQIYIFINSTHTHFQYAFQLLPLHFL